MTRSEAVAIIEKALPVADDAALAAAAELLQSAHITTSVLPRDLTEFEFELIEQSRADFRQGRTYTPAEARSYIEKALTRRRQQREA